MTLKKSWAHVTKNQFQTGKPLVKVIHKTASVDYRKAFNHLNGEQILLDQDESIDDFKRESGMMQIQVINEAGI